MNRTWRLLKFEQPTSAEWNMAVDEMLLEGHADIPILRFYTWKDETLSVGYFQNINTVSGNLPVIRRLTGGGQVHHGRDLTLSLVMPVRNSYIAPGVRDSYRDIHQVMLDGLQTSFPLLSFAKISRGLKPRRSGSCFDEPVCFDLCLNQKKVLGSSQRRRGQTLLHQTAIFLDAEKHELTDLIIRVFIEKFGIHFIERPLDKHEKNRAKILIAHKYATPRFFKSPAPVFN